jgi:hypothetical protein
MKFYVEINKGGAGSGIKGHTTAAHEELGNLSEAFEKDKYEPEDILQDAKDFLKKIKTSSNPDKAKIVEFTERLIGSCEDRIMERNKSFSESELEIFKAVSGEGSRGGHVIGHTKSGKPVYEVGFSHPSVEKFSHQDHKDAKRLHMGYAEYLDPHPEDGGGGFWNEGGEKFDPTKNPENAEKRAKFHIAQSKLHGEKAGINPSQNHVLHEYVERAFKKIKDMIGGGLADKKKPKNFDQKQLDAGKKVEAEHTSNPKIAQEIAMDHLTEDPNYYIKLKQIEKKSEVFVIDLMKAVTGAPKSNHKYIRRYRKGDRWIYVYHELDAKHGKVMDEDEIKIIHKLAAAGHKDSKDFLANVHDHDEEELKILRALADKGHKPSHELLKEYGIDRDMERIEEATKPPDKMVRDLSPEEKTKALAAISDSAKVMFNHWASHVGNHFPVKAATVGLTNLDSLMAVVKDKNNLKDMLDSLNAKLSEMERAHGTNSPSFPSASAADGYANMVYNAAVKNMQDKGVLPANYHEVHTRTRANASTLSAHLESEHKVKMALIADERRRAEEARAERERTERERREAEERAANAELEGSMASFMNGLLDSPKNPRETLELHRALKNIFGRNLRKEDFPYNFESKGIKTKIVSLDVSSHSVNIALSFHKNGQRITDRCRREFSISSGRPMIYNSILTVPESMRDGTNVSNMINRGQRDLLRSTPTGGKIKVNANIDIGGYTWANCGFSTDSMSDLRRGFKEFLANKGITLTNEEWATFKDPVHIAQFDIGVKKIKTMFVAVPLSQKQIETRSISGVSGKHTLTDEELRTGKSNRIAMSVGKEYLLSGGGRSYGGYWDSRTDNETTRFADNYYTLRDNAKKFLSSEYRAAMARVSSAAPQVTPTPVVSASEPTVPRTPAGEAAAPAGLSDYARSQIQRVGDNWTNGRTGKITITTARLHTVVRWTHEQKEHFISTFGTKLTRDAIRKIRTSTPEQVREQRTASRTRNRDARRARASAARATPSPSARRTTYKGYDTTHGDALNIVLDMGESGELGNQLMWLGDNKQFLSESEKEQVKQAIAEKGRQTNRIIDDLIVRGAIPDNYRDMSADDQTRAFRSQFRTQEEFTAAGGTTRDLDALTDLLNMTKYRSTFDEMTRA